MTEVFMFYPKIAWSIHQLWQDMLVTFSTKWMCYAPDRRVPVSQRQELILCSYHAHVLCRHSERKKKWIHCFKSVTSFICWTELGTLNNMHQGIVSRTLQR
ncbi:hypothetical protein PILCRDRAFT_737306 [Piloderma croceum F 1598]|uniref:Uncharacterized protein n=1 Tax=Piloderma croceum (strain F 1598) TaxID=765440 RepID=A0A0C3B6A0_PILCF|nr:hypothetical protein PILCRDRAFT_737306 [Piloderma croceum F 1598]